jgi:hypothetical protein
VSFPELKTACPGTKWRQFRVYDEAGNVIETHEHAGDFREF